MRQLPAVIQMAADKKLARSGITLIPVI